MKNIVISEKQLEFLTNSVKDNVNEEHKTGSYMAKQQLYVIATLAKKMWEEMDENEQLEDWMETKIAQSEQSITSVVKSFMYDELTDGGQPNIGGMDKLNFNDLVIGK